MAGYLSRAGQGRRWEDQDPTYGAPATTGQKSEHAGTHPR